MHGFGAFLEHYRDNIKGMAEGGNRVWAITLLGFGKSEKPNVVYTEILWAELLRDFIIEVVGEPVHLAGNSIGGMLTYPPPPPPPLSLTLMHSHTHTKQKKEKKEKEELFGPRKQISLSSLQGSLQFSPLKTSRFRIFSL